MWIIHRNYFLKDYQVEKVLWWEGAIESRRVTAKLKGLNKTLLSFHCICHRLALPCANASDDVSFINDVEATLNYLWKFFENSSKKTAAYIQTQENLREINLSKKGRKTVARKMKKVCRRRWPSLDHSLYEDTELLLQTVSKLKTDPIAIGLLKMKNTKYIGAIYILKCLLPY